MVPALHAQGSRLRQERDRTIGIRRLEGLVFTVDLATPGRRYSEVHDGMEKDPTVLGMLGFVAQGATHPRWALDIVTKGWPLKFGTVAEAMPKGVPYGKFVHDNFDASTTWKDIERVRSTFSWKNHSEGHS
jgi:L-lactate dehydrogenase (cytochrome)